MNFVRGQADPTCTRQPATALAWHTLRRHTFHHMLLFNQRVRFHMSALGPTNKDGPGSKLLQHCLELGEAHAYEMNVLQEQTVLAS